MISLKQLRYFEAVARAGHFGRAAEQCAVTQPALSMQVQELEQFLGLQLLERGRGGVILTEGGKEVARRASQVLADVRDIVDFARQQGGTPSGPLGLGVIPSVAPYILPQLLPAIRTAFPDLDLHIRETQTQLLLRELVDGRLDLLLLALPWDIRNAEILPLFRDPFRLACRTGSPLLGKGRPRADQLPPESVLLLEDGHCLRDHALSACRLRRPDKLNRFAASSLYTLVQMVAADLGVTYLPAMAEGSSLLEGTGIETHALDARAYREIGLVWREGSTRAAEFREFGQLIDACRPPGVIDLARR